MTECAVPPDLLTDEAATLDALSAAADKNRLRILFLLGQSGPTCVGDIAKQFRISRPAVSHHLKVLKTNDLVLPEKVGQEIYYRVDISALVSKLRCLADALEQCCPEKEMKPR